MVNLIMATPPIGHKKPYDLQALQVPSVPSGNPIEKLVETKFFPWMLRVFKHQTNQNPSFGETSIRNSFRRLEEVPEKEKSELIAYLDSIDRGLADRPMIEVLRVGCLLVCPEIVFIIEGFTCYPHHPELSHFLSELTKTDMTLNQCVFTLAGYVLYQTNPSAEDIVKLTAFCNEIQEYLIVNGITHDFLLFQECDPGCLSIEDLKKAVLHQEESIKPLLQDYLQTTFPPEFIKLISSLARLQSFSSLTSEPQDTQHIFSSKATAKVLVTLLPIDRLLHLFNIKIAQPELDLWPTEFLEELIKEPLIAEKAASFLEDLTRFGDFVRNVKARSAQRKASSQCRDKDRRRIGLALRGEERVEALIERLSSAAMFFLREDSSAANTFHYQKEVAETLKHVESLKKDLNELLREISERFSYTKTRTWQPSVFQEQSLGRMLYDLLYETYSLLLEVSRFRVILKASVKRHLEEISKATFSLNQTHLLEMMDHEIDVDRLAQIIDPEEANARIRPKMLPAATAAPEVEVLAEEQSIAQEEERKEESSSPPMNPIESCLQQLSELTLHETSSEQVLRPLHDLLKNMERHLFKSVSASHPLASKPQMMGMVKEISSHLLLSFEQVLYAIEAYKKGRFQQAGVSVCVYTAAIDAYVAIETALSLRSYSKTGERPKTHNLQELYLSSSMRLGAKYLKFFKDHQAGILAARYPYHYVSPLSSFMQGVCTQTVGSKEKIGRVLELLKKAIEVVFEGEALDVGRKMLLEQIEKAMQGLPAKVVQHLRREKSSTIEDDLLSKVEALQGVVRRVENKTLQQVRLYVSLLKEARAFKEVHDEPAAEVLHARYAFLVEKIYEEVFVYLCNLKKVKIENIHHLGELAESLQEEIPEMEEVLPYLRNINIGNNTHYLFTGSMRRTVLQDVYRYSLGHLLQEEGFQRAAVKASSEMPPSLDTLKVSCDRLLGFLPQLLDRSKAVSERVVRSWNLPEVELD